MSLRVFLDKKNIWTGRWSQADCPPQCRWASPNPLNRTKRLRREWSLPDCHWARTSVFSCLWTWTQIEIYTISSSGSQAFGLGLESTPSPLLALQFGDWTSWDFWLPWPREPIPYNLSPCLFSRVLFLQETQKANTLWSHVKRYFCFWWSCLVKGQLLSWGL